MGSPNRTCLAAILVVAIAPHAQAAESALWGHDGDAFDPAGRLMDWSWAGYHHGDDPLPVRAPTHDVFDFGAAGDGVTDDTAAFVAALAAADAEGGGVVHAPAGTYVLRDRLALGDGVVLQGDGPGLTILAIPVSLTDLDGNPGLEGGGTSSYAFGGAFIEARGDVDGPVQTQITAAASRGDDTISVASTDGLEVGAWIHLTQTDVDRGLMNRLHADLLEAGDDNVGDRGMDFHARIAGISGTTVQLERALPVDIDLAWSPDVRLASASLSELGVEHLSIEFPLTPYPGHFEEQGYNAVDLVEVAHAWVRDVEVLNADYGINVRGSFFVTVADVTLDTTGDRGALAGHHGLNNGHGGDNLFIGFDIATTFVHDLTNEWYATGVVFTKGRGDDLRMDHHRAAPYTTLWTELDCGAGTSPFVSGGSGNRGPHTAAYDTLWNLRADAAMELPPDDFGPRMNFVGFQTDAAAPTSPYDWWFEAIGPDEIEPPNLWEAMRERRLGPDDPSGTSGSDSSGAGSAGDDAAETGGSDEAGDTATAGDAGAGTTGSAGESGIAGSGETGASAGLDDDAGGCGCANGRRGALWFAGLVLFARRRRAGRPSIATR